TTPQVEWRSEASETEITVPKVHVRLFAGLHDMIGKRDVTLELPDGATIAQLRDRLGEEYPIVQPFLTTLVCAVDEEYVPSEHVLREGEDVALIPPISGGSQSSR